MDRLFNKCLSLLVLLLLSGCTARPAASLSAGPAADRTSSDTTTLTVFAAASLTEAFTELRQGFSAETPGVEVVFNFAGSQQLAQQIAQGAPADLFAAANTIQMNVAIASGRILTDTQRIFAHNELVVIVPSDNPAGLTTLQDLAKPGVKVVFAAEAVPVGRYSMEFLDKAEGDGRFGAGYKAAVIANVVSYEENVRAILAKVGLGEADAGIVYSSDVSGAVGAQVQRIDIPDDLNSVASYPVAPLSDTPHMATAQKFIDYLLSPTGQQMLEKYGFIAIKESK
jgi:molybdate transport system substrate-binding protein